LDYSRDPEKTWVSGALRVQDGKELTCCVASRNSTNYITLLEDIEADNPTGDIFIITDNPSSHNSAQTCAWMTEHPRLHHVFIPTGACWLNLQEGWWRLFRRDALAGQSFATPDEIEQATRVATAQLNRRAKPWIWGRPPKDHRHYRRVFCYYTLRNAAVDEPSSYLLFVPTYLSHIPPFRWFVLRIGRLRGRGSVLQLSNYLRI